MVSPIKRSRRNTKLQIPGRYLLLIVTIGCIGLIFITYNTTLFQKPMNETAGYTIVPFQNGISKIGRWIVSKNELLDNIKDLQEENAKLKEENSRLQADNLNLIQDKYKLQELQELYELDSDYSSYPKTGAQIIAKDTSNWYHSFIINKGTDDGLLVDMNVLSGAGLVGRITSIGSNWARVESIIDDNANVAGSVLRTSDNLIVSGDLSLYSDGVIAFERLTDPENLVTNGDKVVTSNISDKYLPGILIGYVNEISSDPNNLTRSGTITPAVDFAHLDTVLVITKVKQSTSNIENNR